MIQSKAARSLAIHGYVYGYSSDICTKKTKLLDELSSPRLRDNASSKPCQLLEFLNIIKSVDKTKFSCTTLSQMQHHSFVRN